MVVAGAAGVVALVVMVVMVGVVIMIVMVLVLLVVMVMMVVMAVVVVMVVHFSGSHVTRRLVNSTLVTLPASPSSRGWGMMAWDSTV